jgi:hypothetical protein
VNVANWIEYLRGREPLEFPPGQTFALNGVGESSAQAFSWATVAKRALDLELRIQPLSFLRANESTAPIINYRLEIAHGDVVHKFPATPQGLVINNPILPHRGLLARLSSRELRVALWLSPLDLDPPDGATVKVSVQPALGSTGRPSIVMQDVNTSPTTMQQFPLEAREWRVRSVQDGQPGPIGLASLTFVALTGALAAGGDAALYADWTPIPVFAAFWMCDQAVQADYR